MPISDELHHLVENPVPSSDLSQRARERAAEIMRRRIAGIVTSVVAVGVLAVPGALLVRDQSGTVNGAAGSGSSERPAAATTAAGTGSGFSDLPRTTVESGHPDAVNRAEVESAKARLGSAFVETASGIVVEVQTGRVVGTMATFTATNGGGIVGVQWTLLPGNTSVEPALVASAGTPSGALASKQRLYTTGKADGGGSAGEQGAKQAAAGPVESGSSDDVVTGTVAQNGKLQISIKVVQGRAGSPAILPGNAVLALANDLLKAG